MSAAAACRSRLRAASISASETVQRPTRAHWVVQHRNDDPANPIRVINLSYGTDGHGWWWYDPLHVAVEKAWAAGIVVVVATGNDGGYDSTLLTNPATNPNIVAVGAARTDGTVSTADENSSFGPWSSTTWASKGNATWVGGDWMGHRMAGDGWTGTSWASKTWAAATWTAKPWNTATTWADPDWNGRYWSGRYWSGGAWNGRYWSSEDWSNAHWNRRGAIRAARRTPAPGTW